MRLLNRTAYMEFRVFFTITVYKNDIFSLFLSFKTPFSLAGLDRLTL